MLFQANEPLSPIFGTPTTSSFPLIKTAFLFLLLSLLTAGLAQPVYTLPNHNNLKLKNYALLVDHGYSFKQILSDTTLHFVENDSIRLQKATAYWLKIKLASPSHYPEKHRLRVRPVVNNTLYWYNIDSGKWELAEAGITVAADKNLMQGNLPFVLQGGGITNVLYVKMNLQILQPFGYALRPGLLITSQSAADSQERVILDILDCFHGRTPAFFPTQRVHLFQL